MDKNEAKMLLCQKIDDLRGRSYSEIKESLFPEEEVDEVVGSSGAVYCIESQAIWDDQRKGHLRVMVAIDDGGLRALMPLTDSFIIAPDGSFVGEK